MKIWIQKMRSVEVRAIFENQHSGVSNVLPLRERWDVLSELSRLEVDIARRGASNLLRVHVLAGTEVATAEIAAMAEPEYLGVNDRFRLSNRRGEEVLSRRGWHGGRMNNRGGQTIRWCYSWWRGWSVVLDGEWWHRIRWLCWRVERTSHPVRLIWDHGSSWHHG